MAGIGPKRRKALLKNFGSLEKMRLATQEDLTEVVPEQVASDLYSVLHT